MRWKFRTNWTIVRNAWLQRNVKSCVFPPHSFSFSIHFLLPLAGPPLCYPIFGSITAIAQRPYSIIFPQPLRTYAEIIVPRVPSSTYANSPNMGRGGPIDQTACDSGGHTTDLIFGVYTEPADRHRARQKICIQQSLWLERNYKKE